MPQPRLYLSLIPESLVASTLDPAAYGSYLAVGLHGKMRGQAIFFDVDAEMAAEAGFDVERAFKRCVDESTEADPKRSVYISIYRVLERIPLAAIGRLYLATDDGRVLGVDSSPDIPENGVKFHLYQQLAPVKPRVVSRLAPREFCRLLTSGEHPISLPKLAFAEMALDELADDPENATPHNLPYRTMEHLRNCLMLLERDKEKQTKVVRRHLDRELLFRTVRNGFFVGDKDDLLYYPLPPVTELETTHREWWRSALIVSMD